MIPLNRPPVLTIGRDEILQRLREDNPWWRAPPDLTRPPLSWPRRDFYPAFKALVGSPVHRAVVLLGARRVGKTTMLQQLVGELATEQPDRPVLFASLDTPTYADLSLDALLSLFEAAHPHDPRAPRLVLFDEVQYLRDWERHLKVLVDRYPATRFVVSGSAAAALKRASTESGAGRFTDFLLPPLTFAEFLRFEGRMLVEATAGGSPEFACHDIEALNSAFIDYLNYGGYPEALLQPEIRRGFRQFVGRDIVDKVLLRDLPVLYGIADIPQLNRLFSVLAYNTGQEASLEELSRNASVAKPTIRRYLEYLEAAFLVYRMRRVDENARRFRRERGFKIHLANPAMRAALFAPVSPQDRSIGSVTESAVLSQWLHLPERAHVHYARWSQGEVDAVGLDPGTQSPVWGLEIKWSDRPAGDAPLPRGLLAFAARHPEAHYGITTRTVLAQRPLPRGGGTLRLVPAALLAYAVGHISAREDGAACLLESGGLACSYRIAR